MNDTTITPERAVPRTPAPMQVGGTVAAIVPQSFEEIQRVANQVIVGGIAPASLIKWPASDANADEVQAIGRRNVAAVAGVLMAGAELGVPPMAALRLFTSINGRPALFADGNIAVARRAKDAEGNKIAASISTGVELIFDHACPYCEKKRTSKEELREHILFAHKDEDPTEPGTLILSDHSYGWCEAKRADTGEVKREEFSISDAKLARLWDDQPTVKKYGWHTNETGKRVQGEYITQNDSPWHRYWKRMLKWRAIGYCLRELFADVLAGMLDEFEAREIEGLITLAPPPPTTPSRPTPPTPPPAEEDENQDAANESEKPEVTGQGDGVQLQNIEHPAAPEQPGNPTQAGGTDGTSPTSKAEPEAESSPHTTVEPDGEQHVEEGEAPGPVEVTVVAAPTFEETAPTPPTPPAEEMVPDTSDTGRFLAQIDETLATATNEEEVDRLWDELDVQHEFADDEVALTTAFNMKAKHTERAKRLALAAAGQGDLLGGGNG